MPEAANDSCHVCGKEASDECAGCHDALYCSVSCQKQDWKVLGHKPLCRGPELNRKIHNILQDLFATEWRCVETTSICYVPTRQSDYVMANDNNRPE
jgi:hypothetical protein